ncbi:MAG: uroporphyrinogen decarboxylase [Beijerinckiaceae bacterium]
MDALAGIRTERVPIWIMRQAGRYLPEYRELRAKAGSFLDLCFTPELAVEATLQPIRRFEFDAAILFSDILVVPHALGQKVWFVEGEGPRLSELQDLSSLSGAIDLECVGSVFEAIRTLRGELSPTTTLLGFCGAPWTVAGYMIAGRGGESLEKVRHVIYQQPKFLKDLIGLLETASISYLSAQIEAGADAVQIFESFAGSIPPQFFRSLSLDPISRIVSGVRERHPTARIIVFARGAGPNHASVASGTGADAVGVDWGVDAGWAAGAVQSQAPVQGNLDPFALVAGGEALESGARGILEAFAGGPHIFNLGHGIVPETPIAHVERMIEIVRGFKAG